MKRTTRRSLLSFLIPTLSVVCLLVAITYASYPVTPTFEWDSLNPLTILSGVVFLLSFGFGLPVFLSILVLCLLIVLLWLGLWWIVGKIL